MDKLRSILHTVRNFLFSTVNKEFLIFLFFLALSAIFWLMMTLNETYEREFEIPVRITNVPKNVVLTSDETDTIKVTLRDKGMVLLGYMYGEGLQRISLNFDSYSHSNENITVQVADLQRMLYQRLSASTKITTAKPDKVVFTFNYGLKKRVPVRWRGRVLPEHLYFISGVSYWPDSVDVYASKAKLDSIKVIYTENLHYANFRDTLSVSSKLQKIRGTKIMPDKVRVKFFTDVLTEESINDIPIVGINVPAGKVIRTFPAKVKVRLVTGVSRFRELKPADFTVVVDYNEIARQPSDKCYIYLKDIPKGISRATLETNQVDYLIEENEP